MRRASYTPVPTQVPSEPLIVVEESGGAEDDNTPSRPVSPPFMMNPDSPLLNPCLLSPYRDMRKRSLPTPACTSGITASQVRRLSEHGVDSTGAAAREAAFLATLSSTPTPAPGGRRHSVVTISRAPPPSLLFGRGRRESIAAFPAAAAAAGGGGGGGGAQPRVLASRRDSTSSVPRPPATSSTGGSNFNLQLDIMDDIAEIKAARKVRLKMWRTPSRERVCEVQPLDAGGPGTSTSSAMATRYHQQQHGTSARSLSGDPATGASNRRYSDFTSSASSIQPPAIPPRRRASEQTPATTTATSTATSANSKTQNSGIVCSNTDLISILSSLATSAQEINRPAEESSQHAAPKVEESPQKKKPPPITTTNTNAEHKRSRLKSLRSNSFDISMLLGGGSKPHHQPQQQQQHHHHGRSGSLGPASWFVKRHQPRKPDSPKQTKAPVVLATTVSADKKTEPRQRTSSSCKSSPTSDNKVVWDGRSGSVVDAQVLGSAIEVFLARRGSGNNGKTSTPPPLTPQGKCSPTKTASGNNNTPGPAPKAAGGSSWFASATSKDDDEAASSDTCDTSICSTLKDLFVK